MKRRKLLQTIGLATGGLMLPVGHSSWVARGFNLNQNPQRLVVIMLRGGIDGLNAIIPHQDPDYYALRPRIGIPKPGETDGAIDLDGFFGLHPGLSPLMPFWKQQNLAFICNSGSPDPTRSHFDAQDYLESGTPGVKNTDSGWLNRLLAQLDENRPTQALNVGNVTPRILQGKMSVANLRPGKNSTHKLPVDKDNIGSAFDRLYASHSKLAEAYQKGRQARNIILTELTQEMDYASGNAVAPSKFVDDAAEVARLIAGDAKTQLAFMDVGGWDTHINEPGVLKNSLPPLARGLTTLIRHLGKAYNNTIIVVMSEFGRTARENGNNGTDHGHGNFIWLLGGSVKGGRVYGNWTGLTKSDLYQGRDLPVNTDYREAIALILEQHLSIPEIGLIFPNYQLQGNLNFLR